jgi:hypothetical protein
VAFEFKPYFKVEVGGTGTPVAEALEAPVTDAPETLAEAVASPVDELAELGPIEPEVVPEEVGLNGRRGLFGGR